MSRTYLGWVLAGTTVLLSACGAASVEEAAPTPQADADAVCFYEHIDYGGDSFCANADSPALTAQWDNAISSVSLEAGYQVELFVETDYGGDSLTLSTDEPDFRSIDSDVRTVNLNDLVSSFRITLVDDGDNPSDPDNPGDPDGGPQPLPSDPQGLFDKCNVEVSMAYAPADPELRAVFINIYAEARAGSAMTDVCRLLYRHPDELGDVLPLEVIPSETLDEPAQTVVVDGEVNLSVSNAHLRTFLGDIVLDDIALAQEFEALVLEELATLYQRRSDAADEGLLSGVASFVSLARGEVREGAQPNKDGAWNDGGATTGYFLLWLSEQYPDSVYKLNLSLSADDWTEQVFEAITGKTVDELWQDYRDDG